jgi:uncharacterized protein (DUF2235 family)
MKRLVLCFDGTWNKLDADLPTNVVLTAESVLPLTQTGIAQVIHYGDGVGTAKHTQFKGGLFGAGLMKNMADGYRFLIFNYTPGDEIYVFGFSSGAYTARSFVGLINTCGIIQRSVASKVNDAIDLYRNRKATHEYDEQVLCFRRDNSPDICMSTQERQWRTTAGLPSQNAPLITIRYVGVWDTVGALGIPSRYFISRWLDKKFQFHDASLSSFVQYARHAVAIDERRKDFVPTLWDNTDALNAARNAHPTDADARYQQKCFLAFTAPLAAAASAAALQMLRSTGFWTERGRPVWCSIRSIPHTFTTLSPTSPSIFRIRHMRVYSIDSRISSKPPTAGQAQ